ncbi:MAG TPA: DUF3106 domain-containing protein [Verrucomicrobiae bacterium]|nr:DUF3106 domain-containing protein [Verrucomicrobiae bacterium]
MIHPGRHTTLFLPLVLAIGIGVSSSLRAQPAVPSVRAENAASVIPPPLPPLTSPVDQFRALLALSPAAREGHLTNRPPAIRQRILAKLQEYDAMKPDERELRLRNTQLRWYLLFFMQMPPANRAPQLAAVPEADRPFVQAHLDDWDKLPPDEQAEILKYEKVIENLLARGFTNPAVTTNIISSDFKNLDAFLKLPQEQRQQMYDGFQRFFELSDAEKEKTLGVLPPAERVQMEAALKKFAQLPKARRARCLNSFSEFSNMNEAEREEFIRNAERWRELSPAERQAWRELVYRLPKGPPLPPGIAIPPPLPPMPPVRHGSLQVNNAVQATNSNP